MQYVPFGKLGFDVSRLGMGCMRLPTMQQDGKTVIDREAAISLIRRGIDRGVNYVDTAYGYHDGESEIVVGQALKDGYREKVRLTSKLPVWLVKEAKDMNRLLDEQLKKLDVPYLDFYILHAMNKDRMEQMRALHYQDFLKEALADGRIRHTGFSFHDDKEAFLDILHDYDNWGLAQIQFNYLDDDKQATEDGLIAAGKAGVPIVIMEPLRGGALANPPQDVQQLMDSCEVKRSAVEWAFSYIADYAEVATILSGMSSQEQLDENLAVFDRLTVGSLTDADKAFIKELKKTYLARMPIGCTGCRYCVPCPNDVHIPNIFHAYNENTMLGQEWKYSWNYKNMVGDGHDASKCVGCGACEGACPQSLPIIDLLAKIDAEFKK
ncbi:MAG: aldo/keto reductase [Clostridiales bacterium]|nr:aldo/keto reductase [Clostridiales bacterium]